MKYKVSVIIPIYNAEIYLAEALDSIVSQSLFADTQILAVDDGSTDRSRAILEQYQSRYPSNIQIFHQKNSGVSAARNCALDAADSEYIFFLDADDVMDTEALKFLYDRAVSTSADIVVAKYTQFSKLRLLPVKNLDSIVSLDEISKSDPALLWTFSLWNKLYRRSVIEKYHIRFPVDIGYSEDAVFYMKCVFASEKISGLDQNVLFYRKNYDDTFDSITTTVTLSKVHDYICAHHLILGMAESYFQDAPFLFSYLSEIRKKELTILLKQFYYRFWRLPSDVLETILEEFYTQLPLLNMDSLTYLIERYMDLPLWNLYQDHASALAHPVITAVLYGIPDEAELFLSCLNKLTSQTFLALDIVLPLSMKSISEENHLSFPNVRYLAADTEGELFTEAFKQSKSEYMLFCDSHFLYTETAFTHMYKQYAKNNADFLVFPVYDASLEPPQPVPLHWEALQSLSPVRTLQESSLYECILANKLIRTEFLKCTVASMNKPFSSIVRQLYENGHCAIAQGDIILYDSSRLEFQNYFNGRNKSYFRRWLNWKQIHQSVRRAEFCLKKLLHF